MTERIPTAVELAAYGDFIFQLFKGDGKQGKEGVMSNDDIGEATDGRNPSPHPPPEPDAELTPDQQHSLREVVRLLRIGYKAWLDKQTPQR